jgi:RND family efflux transporter MFP subunit
MSRKKKIIIIISAIIILIIIALVYLRVRANINAAQKKTVAIQSVKVMSPETGDISDKLLFSGDMMAFQQANIYSRITGNIEKIYVDVGDFANTGKLLAEIDKSQYLQNVKQAEAQLNQYQATLENNRINLDRIKILYSKGLSSQVDLDNAVTQVRVSETQVAAAEANLTNANLQLGYCRITAPFSGYITKRFLDVGALVSSGTTNSIFILSDISRLKLIVSIPEKNLTSIDNIHSVDVLTDAYKDRVFSGEFKKISQSFDLNNRTMPAEIWVDNSDKLLKPGMFAKIEILLEKHTGVMLLPVQCIRNDDKGNYVFVVNDGQTAQKKYVQTGIAADNKAEITSGLDANDKVVFVGQELINDNSIVKISQ